jgi:hypothetical protein
MMTPKTTRRKIQPAGPLDWSEPDRSQYVSWWRFQFLRAALALSPEMETGLRELLCLRMNQAPDEQYFAALVAWAKRFNLIDDEWCRTWVRKTLELSHYAALRPDGASMADGPRLAIVYGFDGAPAPIEQSPVPVLDPWNPVEWNPVEMSSHEWQRRAADRCMEYLARVENAYRQVGYAPIAERREIAHCEWLAGYQVCGWSKKRIHDAAKVDRAAVLRAIRELAESIGLTLRPETANDPSQTAEIIHEKLDSLPLRLNSIPA